jgi:hypothetical protein
MAGIQRDLLGSAIGAGRLLLGPPWGRTGFFWVQHWGRTDFFGVDPKKVRFVFSAAPPSARPLGPLTRGRSST